FPSFKTTSGTTITWFCTIQLLFDAARNKRETCSILKRSFTGNDWKQRVLKFKKFWSVVDLAFP
ncbi:hypothetical protein Mgra_00005979, partial [Meloidogyne graminicola]